MGTYKSGHIVTLTFQSTSEGFIIEESRSDQVFSGDVCMLQAIVDLIKNEKEYGKMNLDRI